MHIKCWGSRGSIPVSGKEYIKYGGDTTCIELRTKSNDIIIIDAGTGIRRLGNQLIDEGRYEYHFIFTHAHWDHLMGFPFFKPLYHKHTEIRIHGCPFPDQFVKNIISRVLEPPHFPVRYEDLKAKISYVNGSPTRFQIGSVSVIPISISHPNSGCGYKFIENGRSFVFLTDNELGFIHPGGLAFKDYRDFVSGADFLIHDAEYTPKEYQSTIEWGHSAYSDVLDLAVEAKVKQLGLFHLNQERTDFEMDNIIKVCRQTISEKDIELECRAVGSDMVFEL